MLLIVALLFSLPAVPAVSAAEKPVYGDANYLSAVERGDMETAQKMVDEAARAAGYDMHLYHGAKSGGGFTVFKGWQFFTKSKPYAEKQ